MKKLSIIIIFVLLSILIFTSNVLAETPEEIPDGYKAVTGPEIIDYGPTKVTSNSATIEIGFKLITVIVPEDMYIQRYTFTFDYWEEGSSEIINLSGSGHYSGGEYPERTELVLKNLKPNTTYHYKFGHLEENTFKTSAELKCAINYSINDWGTGAYIIVKVTNNSSELLKDWNITWTFKNDEKIQNMWGANFSQNGQKVLIKPVDWNQNILPQTSISFGFIMTCSKSTQKPEDINFSDTSQKPIVPELPATIREVAINTNYELKYNEAVKLFGTTVKLKDIIDSRNPENLNEGEASIILDIWGKQDQYLGSLELKAPPATPSRNTIYEKFSDSSLDPNANTGSYYSYLFECINVKPAGSDIPKTEKVVTLNTMVAMP